MSAYLGYLAESGNMPHDIDFAEEPDCDVPGEEYNRNCHYSSDDVPDAERDLPAPELMNISVPATRPTTSRSEAAGATIAPIRLAAPPIEQVSGAILLTPRCS